MQWENLYYALTQFVHNFGAVAIVAAAIAGYKTATENYLLRRKLAYIVLIGWLAQVVSGMTFGAITMYFYGEFPDLHLVAQFALLIKVLCATCGIVMSFYFLKCGTSPEAGAHRGAWRIMAIFGSTALVCAAFLRWFS